MSVKYAPSKLRVPPGFQYLLEGLAREVLREQPEDIIKFADKYFKLKVKQRREGGLRKVEPESAEATAPPLAAEEQPADNEIHVSPSQEEEDAAIKIQSMMRGAKARKEVDAMRASTTNAMVEETPAEPEPVETTPATAEEEPFEMPEEGSKDEEELLSAATKIQAVFRGHKTRKVVEEIKTSSHEMTNTEEAANAEEVEDTPAEDSPAAETAPEDSAAEADQPSAESDSATTDYTLSDLKTEAEEIPTTETETETDDIGETDAFETTANKSESETTESEIKTEETTSDSTESKTETEDDAAPESADAPSGEKTDPDAAAGAEDTTPSTDAPAPADS